MRRLLTLLAAFACCALPLLAAEAEGGEEHGHAAVFLFEIVTLLIAAKIGGEIFERVNQPAVLGELIFGVILGNLHLMGWTFMSGFQTDEALILVAEIGVILLLFEVGLESNLDELLAVGSSAMLVAILGIIAPMILGYGVSMWFLPEAAWYVHTFVGATLAATSVGITARVLKDMGKMDTKEARIILGAAVVGRAGIALGADAGRRGLDVVEEDGIVERSNSHQARLEVSTLGSCHLSPVKEHGELTICPVERNVVVSIIDKGVPRDARELRGLPVLHHVDGRPVGLGAE